MPKMTEEEMLKLYDDTVNNAKKKKFTEEEMLKFYDDGYNQALKKKEDPPQDETPMWESLLRGGAQGASYGGIDEATGAAESAISGKTYEQARDESRKAYDKAREDNPKSYLAGELGGAVFSPVNKLFAPIGAGVSALKKAMDLEKYSKLLNMAKVATTGAAQGAVAGLGYGDGAKDVATGAGISSVLSGAAHVAPLSTAAGLGIYALNNGNMSDISYPEIAALGLGSVADILTKTPQGRGALSSLKNGLAARANNKEIKKSYEMMKPLERLESAYEETGSAVPKARRKDEKMYYQSPMSDSMRDIYAAIDDITIQSNDALSAAEKNILSSEMSSMGDLRHKTLGEVLANNDEKKRIFKTIDELNKSRGVKEDAQVTIDKQIEAAKMGDEGINPFNEKISSFLVGRMMKPSYSHAQPLATAMAYANKMGTLGERETATYENLLRMNQEVKAGILNKWFQSVDSEGAISDDVTRYFRGKNQLSPDDVHHLEQKGVQMFPSKKDLMSELKNKVAQSKSINQNPELINDRDLLRELRDKLEGKSFDPAKGQFLNASQNLTDMKIDLRNMGQDSNYARLPEMQIKDDVLEDILAKYKGNPEKINETIDLLSSAGFTKEEQIKALSNKNKNLDYLIRDIKSNKAKLERDAAFNEKLDLRASEKRRKEAEKAMINSQMEEAKKSILQDRNDQISSYQQRLFDINEGKRQISMDRPDSRGKMAIDMVPGSSFVGNSFKKISDFLSKRDIKNLSKNEEYYRDLYAQGKENLSKINQSYEKIRPEQIADSFMANPSFLHKLSMHEGKIGDMASDILQSLQNSGIDGAKSKLFLLATDPDFRRMFGVDKSNSNPENQVNSKPWAGDGTPATN